MERRRQSDPSPNRSPRSDRALVRSILRLLVLAVCLVSIVVAAVTVGPIVLEELEELDDVEIVDRPAPSSEPPPAGERDPAVTDPGDPGESSYETNVETVTSPTVEDFIHAEVNDRRAEHDLESLEWDGTVASVSRAHSYDMAERDYFAHTNPDGEAPFDRFTDIDDYCRAYGENIALTWVDRPVDRPGEDGSTTYYTAEELATGLVDQWMDSPPHREAILDEHGGPGWDRGGIGVYLDDDGSVYATHNFCHEW
ncbi:CAP domain-containing protein [Salinadaptatus halalkaliphilus]|uniref:CAP domain-containing protein n=1 Tax=Salinadaptatus halalkaliphilus TaxID=2419781 RepID=A0A4S3TNP4_9EURY|nr:CAP domain-containing protein [Salinadaptatus halalkaliphilus]THE64168.1 CAP domain-containing protein [Salinadaptatus halalkaliphilus]